VASHQDRLGIVSPRLLPLLVALFAMTGLSQLAGAAEASATGCSTTSTAAGEPGAIDVVVVAQCGGRPSDRPSNTQPDPALPTRIVDCGVNPTKSSLPECKETGIDCTATAAAAPAAVAVTAVITYVLVDGTRVRVNAECRERQPVVPGVSEADVRVEVVRRVPSPVVMAAPSGRALVQLESLFWVDTARSVDLGSAGLAGHQVSMTASVESVAWDFGDGARGSSAGPGRPFTKDSHCGQKQCPGWFGHTYTATGSVVVTARVSWSASYRVDGGSAQVISGTVVGSPATMSVVVKQARAVLVPNPNDH